MNDNNRLPKDGTIFTWDQLFTRRQFIGAGLAAGTGLALSGSIWKALAKAAPNLENGQETEVFTLCEMCVWRCGVKARVRNVDGVPTIVKLEGNPDHPNNYGKLCPRGNAGIMLTYDPDRLKFPLIRAGERGSGLWRKASWEEALNYVAKGMGDIKEKYGAKAMVMSSTHNLSQPFFETLLKAYGTPNYGTQRSLCFNAMTVANYYTYGLPQPGVDYKNCKYLILTGRNLAESISNSETQDFVDLYSRGAKVVLLDPRFSKTASKVDQWLPIKPGTDLAFFLALCQVIIQEGLYDKEFVTKNAVGFDDFAQSVRSYTPQWAANLCGIPAETITRIAREFAAQRPAAVAHPNWRTSNFINSYQTQRTIAVLNALMGNWNAKGGLIAAPGEEAGPKPGQFQTPPFPAASGQRLDGVPWKYPLVPLMYGVYQELRNAIYSGKPYPAKGWLIYRQNPVLSLPERAKTIAALKKLDLVAVIDVIPNDTAYYADVILPEHTYLERFEPLMFAGDKFWLRQPVIKPLWDTKSGLEIFKELGTRLGLGAYFPYKNEEDFMNTQIKPFGVTLEQVKQKGYIQVKAEGHSGGPAPELKFDTVSGKIEIASSVMAQAGKNPLPVWEAPPSPPAGQFYLLSGKVAQHTQMGTQNNRWLHDLYPTNPVWINTETAKAKGIQDGDEVVVASSVGKVKTKAFVTEGIRQDSVFLVAGFGHLSKALNKAFGSGVSDSALHETFVDPVSGGQALSQTFVTVEKA